MGTVLVVVLEPGVQVDLQLLQRPIDLLPKRYTIELVQHRLMKPFTDPVRLRVAAKERTPIVVVLLPTI
jgi:hypothetical protein